MNTSPFRAHQTKQTVLRLCIASFAMESSSSDLDVDESILKRVKKAFTRYHQIFVLFAGLDMIFCSQHKVALPPFL